MTAINKRKRWELLHWIILILPYGFIPLIYFLHVNELEKMDHATIVVISKQDMTLSLYKYSGELIMSAPIASGKNNGNKSIIGDMKTPEGVFHIVSIEESSNWTHDFKNDSLGPIQGAYGPYFIRINVPGHKGIGIHGTHDNSSLGQRITEGCIRLNNDDLTILVKHLSVSNIVIITPGIDDIGCLN